MPRVSAIVVAGGRSVRFGGPVPKQFLDLGGEPVVVRSLRAVGSRPGVDGAVVVLPREEKRILYEIPAAEVHGGILLKDQNLFNIYAPSMKTTFPEQQSRRYFSWMNMRC